MTRRLFTLAVSWPMLAELKGQVHNSLRVLNLPSGKLPTVLGAMDYKMNAIAVMHSSLLFAVTI